MDAHETSFIRPKSDAESTAATAPCGTLVYEKGMLYVVEDGVRRIINCNLPKVEWYENVELARSPIDPNEIWIAIGGKDLFCSRDGGKSVTRCREVSHVADLGFVPVLHSESDYNIYLFGTIGVGRPNGYTSLDGGATWTPYDPAEFLPLA